MPFLIIFVPSVDPGPDSAFPELLLFLLIINILLNLPIDLLSSYGMYRIARMDACLCPWLAWIPLVNLWVLGSIADNQRKLRGKRTGLRWILLVYILFLVWLYLGFKGPEPVTAFFNALLPTLYFPYLLFTIAGITSVYMSLHGLFASCYVSDPTAHTVICVFFSLPTPFLIHKAAKIYD